MFSSNIQDAERGKKGSIQELL